MFSYSNMTINKFRNRIVMLAGFLNWILAIGFVPRDIEFTKILINGIGAFGFFLVALLLPKYQNSRSFGRRTAIGWMSFLIYLVVENLLISQELVGVKLLLSVVPIVVAFGTYAIVVKILDDISTDKK